MNKTSIEAEIKIEVDNLESVESQLKSMGAKIKNSEKQIDLYYNHPCRDYSVTDEAVRLRRRMLTKEKTDSSDFDKFPLTEITYKGPKLDKSTKTRVEYSVGVDSYENAKLIFSSLGFIEVAIIEKQRVFYTHGDITISLDNVLDVGCFMELERVVTSPDLLDNAQKELVELLESLGYSIEDSIRESYLELYLAKNSS
jgi:adenylate cyclase class 2